MESRHALFDETKCPRQKQVDEYAHLTDVRENQKPALTIEPMKYKITYAQAIPNMGVKGLQEFKADDDAPQEKELTAPTVYEDEETIFVFVDSWRRFGVYGLGSWRTETVYAEVLEAEQGTNEPTHLNMPEEKGRNPRGLQLMRFPEKDTKMNQPQAKN